MSLAITYCRAQYGMDAPLVTVETHLSNGLPAFNIVGLAQTTVKESKDRVRSALINSHFEFPQRRITINLAPAELPKQGGRYDLAIAIGILAASGQIPKESLNNYEFLGELSLSGELRAIHAALPAAIQGKHKNRFLIFPQDNAQEISLSQHTQLFYAAHLLQVSAHLLNRLKLPQPEPQPCIQPQYSVNFDQVKGQEVAKRALCIAAAGRHHILMFGPPGSGKTLLASCLPSILPPMNLQETLESASIYSLDGSTQFLSRARSFCAPHHSASAVSLVGGGNPPRPGEISRAHQGVLFLDELPEFQRSVLEMLREPLESGEIIINRASHKIKFLSRFILVAAMNLCPCGFYASNKHCRCTPDQIQRYHHRISGPLLDRIDMHILVRPVKLQKIQTEQKTAISNENLQSLVLHAQTLQMQRQNKNNSDLNNKELSRFCQLTSTDHAWFIAAIEQLQLSMRSYHRLLKVARTIADLADVQHIQKIHLQEALSLRHNTKMQL